MALYFCFLSVKTLFFGDGPISAGLFLLCPTLLFVYTSVYHADCTMRYFNVEETISIQDGCLVIECTHTLFRIRKRIPLTGIAASILLYAETMGDNKPQRLDAGVSVQLFFLFAQLVIRNETRMFFFRIGSF